MKQVLQKWNDIPLILRIAMGIVVGAILGLTAPKATFLTIFGDIFVGALKGVAPVLVFVLIISALSKASDKIGSRFRTVIILYVLSTLMASMVSVLASYLFPITLKLTDAAVGDPPAGIAEVLGTLINNMVQNPLAAIISGNYIGVLTWAVVFGIAFRKLATDETKDILTNISDAASVSVCWIISLAPFGVLGLVFQSVSDRGLSIFVDYGKLLFVLIGCMLFVAFVVNPFIVFVLLHKNPYPLLFRCIKESGVTAFFTRSSAANIPVNMQLCRNLGLDKDMYSISIPLGATINMDGAAITIGVMTLATANTLGIAVDFPSTLMLCILATLGACGASGVAGGSILLIPMACSLFGISNDIAMQVVGVGFIIGVFQDSMETALNSSGDVLFTATAEFYQWRKQGKEIKF